MPTDEREPIVMLKWNDFVHLMFLALPGHFEDDRNFLRRMKDTVRPQ